jgi:hypothetical protein
MNGFEWALLFVIATAPAEKVDDGPPADVRGDALVSFQQLGAGFWDTGYRTETHFECYAGMKRGDDGYGVVYTHPRFCLEDNQKPLTGYDGTAGHRYSQCAKALDYRKVKKVCLPVKKGFNP